MTSRAKFFTMKTRKGNIQKPVIGDAPGAALPNSGLTSPTKASSKSLNRPVTVPVHGRTMVNYEEIGDLAAARRLFTDPAIAQSAEQTIQSTASQSNEQTQQPVEQSDEQTQQPVVTEPAERTKQHLIQSKKTLKVNENFQATKFFDMNESGPSAISLFADEKEDSDEEVVIIKRKRKKPAKANLFVYDEESSGDENKASGLGGFWFGQESYFIV